MQALQLRPFPSLGDAAPFRLVVRRQPLHQPDQELGKRHIEIRADCVQLLGRIVLVQQLQRRDQA